MSKTARRLILIGLAGGPLLAGCVVGPNFHPPAAPAIDRYLPTPLPAETASTPGLGGVAQRFVAGAAVPSHWWTAFGAPGLDALEEEALKRNADLDAARAALRQAHELYLAQRASVFPSAQFAANGSRSKNSATIAPPLSSNAEYYSLYTAQLNVSYVLDVFGGERRQNEAAAAQAENQRFQTEAVYLTLTTNVANAALQVAGLRAQLDDVQRVVAANRETLDLVRHMQAAGENSTADVAAAETALEQAEQLAPPLRKQLEQQNDLLAVLLGRPPAEAAGPALALADFTLPRDLPVSLPADLVRRRPDIRAAEANLHVASAQVGVAEAARLPSFTLDGSVGGASSTLRSLVDSNNSLLSIGTSTAQTVFDAGALRHRQRAAEAALDQAKAQYRGAVLAGLQNTADVLQAIIDDADALKHAARAADAAEHTLAIARAQLERGQAGALGVLSAEAAWRQAEVSLDQARAARYLDTVALLQALGGWWNPENVSGARAG